MLKAAKGTRDLALQSMVNALLGMLIFAFIARVLSREELGIYAALSITLSIAVILGVFGLDYAAARYIPYLKGQGNKLSVIATERRLAKVAIISSSIATLIFFSLAPILSQIIFGTETYSLLFRITAITIFPAMTGMVALGFLQGLQRFPRIAMIKMLAQLTRLATTVGLLLAGFGIIAVMIGWGTFSTVLLILALPILIRELYGIKHTSLPDQSLKKSSRPYGELMAFSIPMMGFFFMTYLVDSVDSYVVLGIMGTESLGGYFVVTTLVGAIVTIFAYPLIMTLVPKFSEIHGQVDTKAVSNSITQVSRYVGLFFIPSTFLLASLSPLALRILGGTEYVDAALPLTIISIPLAAYGLSAILISALTAIARTKIILLVLTMAFGVELLLTLILTPPFGLVGAAIGRAAMYLVSASLFLLIGRRYIRIPLDKGALVKSTLASSMMGITAYTVGSLTGFTIWLFPFYLVLSLSIYLMGLLVLRGLKLADIILIVNLVPVGPIIYKRIADRIKKSEGLYRFAMKILA